MSMSTKEVVQILRELDIDVNHMDLSTIEEVSEHEQSTSDDTSTDNSSTTTEILNERNYSPTEDYKKVEESLDKLGKQENMWQQALTDIESQMERKRARTDIKPLKDYVNEKLVKVQGKLKSLYDYKKEMETLGANYLKDTSFCTIDNDINRKKIPCNDRTSYLSYELDSIRKEQKVAPNGRNMNFLSEMLKQANIQVVRTDQPPFRHCGGSHTKTYPAQRVFRQGHFLKQWGEAVQVTPSYQLKGKDGVIYRGAEIDEPNMELQALSLTSRKGGGDCH